MPDILMDFKDHYDIGQISFSFPGSRILIYQYPQENRLLIKLAERLINIFPGLEAYLTRDPFVSDFQLLDGSGKALDFQATTYPHLLRLETSLGPFLFTFGDQDTFFISLPDGQSTGIHFKVHAENFERMERGGFARAYRNLRFETDAEILENLMAQRGGFLDVSFRVEAGKENSIRFCVSDACPPQPGLKTFRHALETSAALWRGWFSQVPPVDEIYREKYLYAWWVLANNQISPKGNIGEQMAVPSKCGYIGAWLWDNALHALAFRHVNPGLARAQILGMLAHQQPDGMLPDAIFDDGIVTEIDHPISGRVTKPPVLAWAAMKIYALAPDDGFINAIYEPLTRWNSWWLPERGRETAQLASYSHPYSSGMDDHPTWDGGMPVISPDINTYLYLQMQALADMADILDKGAEADAWRRRAGILLETMIERLWDEEAGLFQARRDGEAIQTKSIINLFPLWTAGLPDAINQRLIAHLKNEDEFGGDFALPVVARDDFDFSPDKMWRGPVWANINYFMIEALQRIGAAGLAKSLRAKTLRIMTENEGIDEYYNAITGKPGHHAAPIFSWSAAIFIDLAIQVKKEEGPFNGE